MTDGVLNNPEGKIGRFNKSIVQNKERDIFVASLKNANKNITSGKKEQYALAERFLVYLICSGFALTILSFVGYVTIGDQVKEYIKDSWAVFIPIISMIIGYIFGKERH